MLDSGSILFETVKQAAMKISGLMFHLSDLNFSGLMLHLSDLGCSFHLNGMIYARFHFRKFSPSLIHYILFPHDGPNLE